MRKRNSGTVRVSAENSRAESDFSVGAPFSDPPVNRPATAEFRIIKLISIQSGFGKLLECAPYLNELMQTSVVRESKSITKFYLE